MSEANLADEASRFALSFDEYWLPVFRFALSWTNDWSSAEDLAQEAFARLWTSRQKIDWTTPVLPWLLVTTRRLATDRFRRLRRLAFVPRGGSAPALDTDDRLQWLDIQRALSILTPAQRSALVLTTVLGLDAAAAAQALNTSPSAVRAAVSRARIRLSKQ